MSASRQEMERKAAQLWQARQGSGLLRPADFVVRETRPEAVVSPPDFVPVSRTAERLEFSLMFFSAAAGEAPHPDLYRLVHKAARFADARGFTAVWMPERHFHAFGGPYPNPAVLAASLASITKSIRLRAGSVVLPLHHPVEVAETWSMVDNLSGGRVEVAFATGWSPNDFVVSPDTFAEAREVLRQRSDEVRRLWRGDSLDLVNGRGEMVPTRILPVPLQRELPVWISATGNPESFAWAGANGFNVLTMLLGGDIDDIAPKIAIYRAARRNARLDPDGGKIALMLHTFVHADGDFARATIRAPFLEYVRNSVDVQRQGSEEGRAMTETQRGQLIDYAFLRYTKSAALFGSPTECRGMLDRAAAAGVDEIACLIDFGVEEGLVLEALEHLDAMRPTRPVMPAVTQVEDIAAFQEPIAIIGMSGCFAGAANLETFWQEISQGRDLLSAPPVGRDGPDVPPRGGYLADIEGFDAALFGIAPAEADTMDPHQRMFLEQVWAAVEDAGYRPAELRGSTTGVFAAVYSTGHETVLRAKGAALDGLSVVGAVLSMVPNRTSFLFDWTGPSEAVNTACSSGLVAVHRAVLALRMSECGMAVAGGVSLLLAAEESAALARLGLLSPDGVCRAFDGRANGQVRGEGAGVLVLKRLSDAKRDGDFVYALIRGAAVNHSGARANSVTLPNPHLQAACIADAIRRSGVAPERIGYIEAHGAGTVVGDMAELSAFGQAFDRLGAGPATPCRIGSVKSNIGSLDAAGGIAGLIKAALALHHKQIPATLNRAVDPEGFDAEGPFRFADRIESWEAPSGASRAACVHAYGLGGTNAHVVLEEYANTKKRKVVPATTFARAPKNVVGAFYDFVTRAEEREGEIFLTLAPFPAIVSGFSWRQTFQEPDRHPEHWAMMKAAQREMREVLFYGVDFSKVGRVLDFGCGVGTDLIAIAHQNSGLHGTGYTISERQAKIARTRIAAAGLSDRITVHHRDSARDAFPETYDLVFGLEVAHHIEDKTALFANIADHLTDGGMLLLADCAANTVAPICLPEVGSFTSPKADYAELLADQHLKIIECIDLSQEVANFLHDPELEAMIAREAAGGAAGRGALMAAVQRSWDGFGQALRTDLMSYLLIISQKQFGAAGLVGTNRRNLGLA